MQVDAEDFHRLPLLGAFAALGGHYQHLAHPGVGAHALQFALGHIGDDDNILEILFHFGAPVAPAGGMRGGQRQNVRVHAPRRQANIAQVAEITGQAGLPVRHQVSVPFRHGPGFFQPGGNLSPTLTRATVRRIHQHPVNPAQLYMKVTRFPADALRRCGIAVAQHLRHPGNVRIQQNQRPRRIRNHGNAAAVIVLLHIQIGKPLGGKRAGDAVHIHSVNMVFHPLLVQIGILPPLREVLPAQRPFPGPQQRPCPAGRIHQVNPGQL